MTQLWPKCVYGINFLNILSKYTHKIFIFACPNFGQAPNNDISGKQTHTHIHSAYINKLMAFIITYSIYSNTPINALDVFFRENILNAKLGGKGARERER